MMRKHFCLSFILAAFVIVFALPEAARGQFVEGAARAGDLSNRYRIVSNVTYVTANNYEAKLDVYMPRNLAGPNPTMIYIHGGGWVGGSKETSWLALAPYLEAGWSVVNVEYLLARVSLAPAAVEDCRCALRWVMRNAKEYNFRHEQDSSHGSFGGRTFVADYWNAASSSGTRSPVSRQRRVEGRRDRKLVRHNRRS
jgi:hypothetical protein